MNRNSDPRKSIHIMLPTSPKTLSSETKKYAVSEIGFKLFYQCFTDANTLYFVWKDFGFISIKFVSKIKTI